MTLNLIQGRVYNIWGTRSGGKPFSYRSLKYLGKQDAIATDGERLAFSNEGVKVLIPPSYVDEVQEVRE